MMSYVNPEYEEIRTSCSRCTTIGPAVPLFCSCFTDARAAPLGHGYPSLRQFLPNGKILVTFVMAAVICFSCVPSTLGHCQDC